MDGFIGFVIGISLMIYAASDATSTVSTIEEKIEKAQTMCNGVVKEIYDNKPKAVCKNGIVIEWSDEES